MARGVVARGDIWLYQFARPDKRRPVLVLSRSVAIEVLDTVIVAPITRTIHGAPSEVVIGIHEGLKSESAVNLDHVQTVKIAALGKYLGSAGPDVMRKVCHALALATGCA